MAQATTKLLTDFSVPSLSDNQLENFTQASIHAEKVVPFTVDAAIERLGLAEGKRVIGADFGGDKGVTQLFVIKNGALEADDDYSDYVQSTHGDGYLESMEKTALYAQERNIPVGISWGAPLEGSRPLFHPKAVHFLKDLDEKYNGDLKSVFPTLAACVNDGPAGLISGIIEANRLQPTHSVLFPINGGGLGMAVLTDGQLYSTEAGHVKAVQELNKYQQDTPCGVFEATYTCIETLGANKAGIEAQWKARHEYLRAQDIEARYKEGDAFAGELYENSAYIVAHLIQGTADALHIDLSSRDTAIVCHGGAFKFPHYGDRVSQILEHHNQAPSRIILTKDYGVGGSNACLDGAALAAVLL